MLWRIHLDPKIASLSASGPWDGMQLIPLELDRHLLRSALGSNGHWYCQADTGGTEATGIGLSIREIAGGTRLGAPTLVLLVFSVGLRVLRSICSAFHYVLPSCAICGYFD